MEKKRCRILENLKKFLTLGYNLTFIKIERNKRAPEKEAVYIFTPYQEINGWYGALH